MICVAPQIVSTLTPCHDLPPHFEPLPLPVVMSLLICSSLVDEFSHQLPANGYQPTSQLPTVLWPDGASVTRKKQLMLMGPHWSPDLSMLTCTSNQPSCGLMSSFVEPCRVEQLPSPVIPTKLPTLPGSKVSGLLPKLPKRCLSHLDSPLQVAYRPQVLKVRVLLFRPLTFVI
ncbi:unannotated protein [freshwater metagenome]|uniref:Unannotated protein n=1 Tax=freshwater metagenome TaxID=449393 RepID=A0A6J7HHK4_9ZZZZ